MTRIIHKALVEETASNKPNAATAFNLPDSATAPARSFDSALTSGDVVPYHATNGTAWEDGIGTFTAGAPDTLTRSSILDSSTGSAIDFSAGADVIVRIVWPASIATETDSLMRAANPGGRLTLASGRPDYQPRHVVTPSTQDTATDLITVPVHNLYVGTILKAASTSGGLTAGTRYFMGNITTNTFSLHTTLADAQAGTPKVDITGTSPSFIAEGLANTTIYYTPYVHNLIKLWTGYRWEVFEFSEVSLVLSALTSAKPYDIFLYSSSGIVTLEVLAWTSDTARATEVTRQDGVFCKSGDKTRLWVGTLYTTSTTSTEASASKCYFVNAYNRLDHILDVREPATSWTYSISAYRQVNANSYNQFEFILPMNDWNIRTLLRFRGSNSTATVRRMVGQIGLDTTTSPGIGQNNVDIHVTSTSLAAMESDIHLSSIPIGKHYMAALEFGAGTDIQTWYGSSSFQSIKGIIDA